MFSTQEYLKKRTGPDGIGRLSYIQSLINEFIEEKSDEPREQILANLANFAYDPINYGHFKKLNVVDLFLDCLDESNDRLVEFAIGGICNCCTDHELKEHIVSNGGVNLVVGCLSRSNLNTVMSAITSLMFLVTPQSHQAITTLPVIECMLRFSTCANKQLSNLASVFLEDFCSTDQVAEAKKAQQELASHFSLQASSS